MIIYSPFWDTLSKSDETTYSLIKNHRISSSTIDRLRKNRPISTTTINDICTILGCDVDGVMRFIEDEGDQLL